MSRAVWKGPVFNENFFKKFISNTQYYSWNKLNKYRQFTIPYFLVDKHIFLYNGATYRKINITKERVGFKFGACCDTRKYTRKILKKKK
jgi:ribosomal protein S19